uniref:Uncharacterized protein n=1 Tax=Arundo donax TaxID=35708 RepID=A0A0A8Z5S2_ARUDO
MAPYGSSNQYLCMLG